MNKIYTAQKKVVDAVIFRDITPVIDTWYQLIPYEWYPHNKLKPTNVTHEGERPGKRKPSVIFLERGTVNHTNTETLSKTMPGKLLRDRVEHIWAFPSIQIPSWNEANKTVSNQSCDFNFNVNWWRIGSQSFDSLNMITIILESQQWVEPQPTTQR